MIGALLMLSLVVWVFAIVGFVVTGKMVLRWYTGMVARDPEGFKKRMGLDSGESPAEMPAGPFGGVSR